MFSDKKGQNQQPLAHPAQSRKVMGKGSVNSNIDRKGTFKGTSKHGQKTVTKKITSSIAPTGNFGKATKIASGKFNFSKGAPGHKPGTI